jgi:hypothetical protein
MPPEKIIRDRVGMMRIPTSETEGAAVNAKSVTPKIDNPVVVLKRSLVSKMRVLLLDYLHQDL